MLYAAYGSNMSISQMAHRCPNSYIVCNGKLNRWKLVFNVHADIIKTNDENDNVPVVVWNISEDDWYKLDMYEGYPSYYIKESVNVILDSGKFESAIVYIMANDRKGICPPTHSYFDCIKEGYIDNGIDVKYLYDALKYSKENETEYNQYNVKG